MHLLTKTEYYCDKHFEERCIIMFDKKHQTLLDIIKSGADLSFGVNDDDGFFLCRVPNCNKQSTKKFTRTDHYEQIPELPKE